MRHLFLLAVSFFLMHGVRSIPLEERQVLEPLESFVSSVLNIEPTPTTTDSDDSSATPTSPSDSKDDDKDDKDDKDDDKDDKDDDKDDNNDDDDDEKVTTIPEPAVRTSTRSESSSSSSATTTSSASSSSLTSSTPTTSTIRASSTSNTAVPTNPLTAAETPKSSEKDSGGGITPAGIAVAVVMIIAILIAIFIVVWKFHPRVVAWRKKKAYNRMLERTYRPALDGPCPQHSSNEKGLGLSSMEKTRPVSLFALAVPRHQIRRKPVPPAEYPIVEMPRMEKDLPPRPPSLARAYG